MGTLDVSALKDGDIVVVRIPEESTGPEILENYQDTLQKFIMSTFPKKKIFVWYMFPGESMETLSEEDMNEAGWYRK